MNSLVEYITGQLGVSEEQAQGGLGLLLGKAKEKLSGEQFEQISSAVPGIDSLLDSAPESGGGMLGALGGIASKLGADNLGELAGMADGFKKLGLDPDMIQKFIPKIMEWLESNGFGSAKEMLGKMLTK